MVRAYPPAGQVEGWDGMGSGRSVGSVEERDLSTDGVADDSYRCVAHTYRP
jgi:hypothetical protein